MNEIGKPARQNRYAHEGSNNMIKQLFGRWNIVSWRQEFDDGRRLYPMGETPEGFMDYQETANFFCTIVRSDRGYFTTGGQWDADQQEKAEAYNGYFSYGGTFEIQGELVLHHVKFSLFPNWVGGTQRRKFELDGDRLHLIARLEDGTPESRNAIIEWIRDVN